MTASSEQKIPKGYNQIEVGVTPKDWDYQNFGNLYAESSRNGIYKSADYRGRGTRIVNMGEMFGLEFISDQDMSRVALTNHELSASGLKDGDLLFGRRSVVPAGAGKCSLVVSPKSPITFESSIIRVRVDKTKAYPYFYYYFFSSPAGHSLVGTIVSGTNIKGIRATELRELKVPLPNIAEQKAIATALSDVDSLIEKLKKLIEKKKYIKQGAMQELLTGKRRLFGFNGKWKEKKLSDVCGKITTGKLNANAMVEGGEYRFYTCAEDYYQIDNYAFDTEALLVSGNGANVGYIHYYKGKFNAYQRTYVLSDFSADIQYIKLFMDRNLQERIRVEVNAGNTPYITMGTLTDMQIVIPPTKEEQNAISTILFDMDTEIEKLEYQLSKYKNLKQGMMQNLLTGKIRLIKNNYGHPTND